MLRFLVCAAETEAVPFPEIKSVVENIFDLHKPPNDGGLSLGHFRCLLGH